jgi:hypothetical protein
VRQLDADLRRFFARRMVRGAFLLAAIIVVISVSAATMTGKESRQVERNFGYEYDENGVIINTGPTFIETTSDTRIDLEGDLQNILEGTAIAMLFLAFVLGASYIGAEHNVGSLTTQLMFEPRRGVVHASKAGAVAIGTAVVSLAVSFLISAGLFVGSKINGVDGPGPDAGFWIDRVGDAGRLAAVVALGGVMAYTVTLVLRRSSAGIIAFFLQYPLLFIISPEHETFGFVSKYMPLRSLLTVLVDPSREETALFDNGIRTVAGGVAVTAVWIVALMAVSGRLFARAEVR